MNAIEQHGYGLEPVETAPSKPATSSSEPSTTPTVSTMANVLYERRIKRKETEEAVCREAMREAYRTPVLMFVVGVAGVCLLFVFTSGFASMATYLLSFIISVPIGLGVYLLGCAIWIGFNERFHLIALNLLGIFAVTDLVFMVFSFIPTFGIFAWFVAMIVYMALLSQRFEIDLGDALIVGLLTFLARLIIVVAIFAALA